MGNDASKVPTPQQGANDADSQRQHDSARQKEISRMDSLVRGRVRGTTTYNMKIVIRGDKGTGKTNLWRRLQGQSFNPNHVPTPELQSATITWNFKSSSEEIAKVQIWDVVDQALLPADTAGGMGGGAVPKKSVAAGAHRLAALDASTVDVYNNTDCVMFLINPLHRPSLDYVRLQAMTTVPHTVAILLIVNFRDRVDTARNGNDKDKDNGKTDKTADLNTDDDDDDATAVSTTATSSAVVSLEEVGGWIIVW